MFLHPKHFYKSFVPSLSLNKNFLSFKYPYEDHQQSEVQSKVLIEEIHKQLYIKARNSLRKEYYQKFLEA